VATKKLWGGRFREALDTDAVALSYTLESDKRLLQYDLAVNKVHAHALKQAGYLTETEYHTLATCIDTLQLDFEKTPATLYGNDEDIHSCIERLVTERCGDLGKKLHTGKSRNDQVITDTRLFTMSALTTITRELKTLIQTLYTQANTHKTLVFPGFTHFQPAQPVLLSHHLLAYSQQFLRDLNRFEHAYATSDSCTLGSGALAGNNYTLNRQDMASELGFSRVSENSMDAVSDRDFICDTLHAASVCMTHLSRFCEEIVVLSSPLIGFFSCSDAFTTGSSLMPQKKNPDVAELIRGKTGRVHGAYIALQTTLKGLPLTYNRDLQEDKVFLFDAVDTVSQCLRCFHKMLASLTVHPKAIEQAVHQGYGVATDFADYLVSKGTPFRDAHDITGAVVLYAIEEKKALHELSLTEFKRFSNSIDDTVYTAITVDAAIAAKTLTGGTALSSVETQLATLKRRIESWNKV